MTNPIKIINVLKNRRIRKPSDYQGIRNLRASHFTILPYIRHLRVDVSLDKFTAITQLVYVQFGGIAAKFEHSGVAHDWSTGSTGLRGSMKAPLTPFDASPAPSRVCAHD